MGTSVGLDVKIVRFRSGCLQSYIIDCGSLEFNRYYKRVYITDINL